MNAKLAEWNRASEDDALRALLACCGARRWAQAMVRLRPVDSVEALRNEADRVWGMMEEPDWMEAFACHPRIGERKSPEGQSGAWSRQEQASVNDAQAAVLARLAEGNAEYEERFGFTYIVCATGKSAAEMLEILERRLGGSRETELREAAEQQRQIMQIRLGKWLME